MKDKKELVKMVDSSDKAIIFSKMPAFLIASGGFWIFRDFWRGLSFISMLLIKE
jgi:hypothetical protein